MAVSVAAQTYLSMLGHGHSFWRILGWQLCVAGWWTVMAPVALRLGMRMPTSGPHVAGWWTRTAMWSALAIALHMCVTAELSLYLHPFVPAIVTDFGTALRSQFESLFVTDVLVVFMLLGIGRTRAVNDRARRLALRESKLEAELARAHLEALRLEIQPHFLFNTLNSIAALIRIQANQKALDMVLGLGALMRATVDRPADHLTPLSTEVEFVRQYLDLQAVRFGDRLDVHYAVEDDTLPVLVPSFLLQPLVENALRHGIARKPGGSTVSIAAAVTDGVLAVTVDDDGVGLPPGFDLARDSGTGLRNIRVRLQQLYGDAARLSIEAAPRSGTRVHIVVPAGRPAVSIRESA
jgi:two-component sensor histidine kinase